MATLLQRTGDLLQSKDFWRLLSTQGLAVVLVVWAMFWITPMAQRYLEHQCTIIDQQRESIDSLTEQTKEQNAYHERQLRAAYKQKEILDEISEKLGATP